VPDDATSLKELNGGVPESRSELLEELARCEEEILQLRDLVIGKEAELEAARARLSEVDGGRRKAKRVPSGTRRLRAQLQRPLQSARVRVLELRSRQR
jgi:chromosome segregation ATPase